MSLYLLETKRGRRVENRFGEEVFVSLLAVIKRIIALDANNFAIGVGVSLFAMDGKIVASSTGRVLVIRTFTPDSKIDSTRFNN